MTAAVQPYNGYDERQMKIIRDQIARGANDDELAYFLEVCRLKGLNPIDKQIYGIMRFQREQDERGEWKSVKRLTIQTAIDGFRLQATRTHELGGIDDAIFDTEDGEHPGRATVTVYRLVQGRIMSFTATARWREYVQLKKDGQPVEMWQKMPWGQLAKCAEALALRKGFPAELGGQYTVDEMGQADNPEPPSPPARRVVEEPHQITAPSPQGRANTAAHMPTGAMGIGEFVREIQKLGIDSTEAMKRLGVKSLSGMNLNEALDKLSGVVEASPAETPVQASEETEPEIEWETPPPASSSPAADDDGITFEEPEPEPAKKPWDALADGELNRLFAQARVRSIAAKEAFLKAQFEGRPYTRDQAVAALQVAIEASRRTPDLKTVKTGTPV